MKLSKQDVEQLLKSPEAGIRREVLLKITSQYNGSGKERLSEEETEVIEVIFRALAKNADVEIRQILAENIKESRYLPEDIALVLAQDSLEIAGPILQYSPALSDASLLDIIKNTKKMDRLLVIARRNNLSEGLTAALLGKKDEALSGVVLNSFGSKISKASYDEMLDNPKVSEKILSAMVEKGLLPLDITEKLLGHITGKAHDLLNEKYDVVFDNKQLNAEIEKQRKLAVAKMEKLQASGVQNKKNTKDKK